MRPRGVTILLHRRALFARGLNVVFGAIQLVYKAFRSGVAFERGEVVAVAGFVGGQRFLLLLDIADFAIEIVQRGLSVDERAQLFFKSRRKLADGDQKAAVVRSEEHTSELQS